MGVGKKQQHMYQMYYFVGFGLAMQGDELPVKGLVEVACCLEPVVGPIYECLELPVRTVNLHWGLKRNRPHRQGLSTWGSTNGLCGGGGIFQL